MPWTIDSPWRDHAASYTGHARRMTAMDDPSLVVQAIVSACTNSEQEMPVGPNAHISNISHRLLPDLTERLSATTAKRKSLKGTLMEPHNGTLFSPMAEGRGVEGGIRERMKEEDS